MSRIATHAGCAAGLVAAVLLLAASAAPVAADDDGLPVQVGMPAAAAIAALGAQASFAPSCLDRSGAALLGPVTWRGEPLWAAALLDANRVSGLRLHEQRDPLQDTDQPRCEAALRRLASRLAPRGVATRGTMVGRFDGPYFRWIQPTAEGGLLAAAWRASRATCQAWYEPPP